MVGLTLPYSRTHEYEADELGLMISSNAGYNPEAAIKVWQIMKNSEKESKSPEWLSTHPESIKRMQKLMALLPRANEIYKIKSKNIENKN